MNDLIYLWRSRHDQGFPWPFSWFGGGVWPWVTGYWRFSPVPKWKQIIRIPLRPYRYVRMVRHIARTRAMSYHPSMQDDVP